MKPIPTPIAEVYEELKTEITWLHGRWIVYRQLFGESERRIEMLNECASAFFYIVQDVLLGEVQVSLCKLTDPASVGKLDNLSLEQLQKRLKTYEDKSFSDQTQPLLASLRIKCQPFRVWRNKRFAHLDLTTSMQSISSPLPGISLQMIEEALSLVRDYMNNIENYYNDKDIGYQHFIMSSDGDYLLALLRNGLRYEELLQKGVVSYDDTQCGKWNDA